MRDNHATADFRAPGMKLLVAMAVETEVYGIMPSEMVHFLPLYALITLSFPIMDLDYA